MSEFFLKRQHSFDAMAKRKGQSHYIIILFFFFFLNKPTLVLVQKQSLNTRQHIL